MSLRDPEIMRSILLDHYENPKNKIADDAKLDSSYRTFNNNSPSCIDNLTAFVKTKDNKIEDVKFQGIGCAIATSSTDIMADQVIGKSFDEAEKIISNYLNMINEKEFDEDLLGELFVFRNVNQQINRIKCAKVGIEAIKSALEMEHK